MNKLFKILAFSVVFTIFSQSVNAASISVPGTAWLSSKGNKIGCTASNETCATVYIWVSNNQLHIRINIGGINFDFFLPVPENDPNGEQVVDDIIQQMQSPEGFDVEAAE